MGKLCMVLFVSFISAQASFSEPEPHEICAEAIKAMEVLWKGHSDLFNVNINVVGWQQGDAQEREIAKANADISAAPLDQAEPYMVRLMELCAD